MATIGKRDVCIATMRKDVLDRDATLWEEFQRIMTEWGGRFKEPAGSASPPEGQAN